MSLPALRRRNRCGPPALCVTVLFHFRDPFCSARGSTQELTHGSRLADLVKFGCDLVDFPGHHQRGEYRLVAVAALPFPQGGAGLADGCLRERTALAVEPRPRVSL